ncbi:MAG: aspartate aminotransferase family protein, partial [Lysobacter sp.]|nr:aspartate aminotransferase family protein [Lysobacter sp.]
MTKILHRNLRGTLPFAASAKGLRITDREGREYIDACGGAAVSCLGHGHPDVLAAMHAQIDRIAYAHTSFFTTEVAEELADTLIADAPAGMSHVYLVSGGSEAMEAALKMARQYFVEAGQPGRSVFIGRRQSYHGNTLGALAVGGNEWRRRQFAPILIDVARVSPCYEYRDRREDESPEAYSERLAAELEAKIAEVGPQRVIAFVAETVVGATAGAVPPTPGYFRRVREICDRHGILLIVDEVMCGMGRTGTLHAIEQEDVVPDLMAIAKGLGGGYQPIGAVLVQGRIIEAFRSGSGLFQHGHTYIGHPVAAAAALAVQKVIKRDGLLEAVRTCGAHFERGLRDALGSHPHVGDIRGRGLFRGVELVEDRATKRPFDPAHRVNAKVKAAAMERGLMVYPMGGTIDGVRGDHVLLAPP